MEEAERKNINDDLVTLSRLFPDIQFDVFRELVTKFDGDSRLHICIEQLLRYRTQWVKGRWHAPPRDLDDDVPANALLRSKEYKAATKRVYLHEFRYLRKSAVEGVLAENNYCYTRARPILLHLSTRTWRATISKFSLFKKRKEEIASLPQLSDEMRRPDGGLDTGSAELDEELEECFFRPARRTQYQDQQDVDSKMANQLNETEAREGDALFECECCYGEATFEKMSSCATNAHLVCHDCVCRTIHEALFGQGWKQSVDVDRGGLKCLAPLADGTCSGGIAQPVIRQAILAEKSGRETWLKFEDRLLEDCLLKSRLTLVRCPFCSYAEADVNHPLTSQQVPTWHIKPARSITASITVLILFDLLPMILFVFIILSALGLAKPTQMLTTSLRNLSLQQRTSRFKCRNPACGLGSCLRCLKAWHDPHTCHEPLLISLRTTVEAARTAAIKRTCPQCGLSFVKSTGCNKLTCVCGYSMCYLCRAALGAPTSILDRHRPAPEAADGGGYRHFCEHFRVTPGRQCSECRKCELYRSEDEDAIVRRAGEVAEREWRVKEGMVGVKGLGEAPLPGQESGRSRQTASKWINAAWTGDWTLQGLLDCVVDRFVRVDPS
jgi:hypothetical protein